MNLSNFTEFSTPLTLCQDALASCKQSFYHNMVNHKYEIVLITVTFFYGLRIIWFWNLEERVEKGKLSQEKFDAFKLGYERYEKILLVPIMFALFVVVGLF